MSARFAVVVGRFYEDLAARLTQGAREVFEEAGAEVDEFSVPGAFELPLAAKYAAESGRYAGVACLGAVIRGETSHYDHVCQEAAHGIARVRWTPACPARSVCSRWRTWTRRSPGRAGASATRAATPRRPC